VSEVDRIGALEQALAESQAQLAERDRQLEERDARITELERKVAELTKVLEAWKRGHRVRRGSKLAQKCMAARRRRRRKPGRRKGHAGTSRRAPEHIDHHQEVAPPAICPVCGGIVDPTDEEAGTQRVEEIVPGRVEVTAYHRKVGRCRGCRAAVKAPLPDGLGDNPKIGVEAQALVVRSQHGLGMSLGAIQTMLAEHYGLQLSRGGLQQILHRAAGVFVLAVDELFGAIQGSSVAWADETTLRVAGRTGYLWIAMTHDTVLFVASVSRGGAVAREIFDGFVGTLHSDFYAVYWTLGEAVAHAPCWGHLIREARQLAERDPTAETRRFARRLSALYGEAVLGQLQPPTPAAEAAAEVRAGLVTVAQDVRLARHLDVARLQRRITRHVDELVAFITDPQLEGTNNRPEREAQRIAIARHISGGARSEQGALTFAINRSVVRTAQLRGVDFDTFFRQARQADRGERPYPTLTPPHARASPPPN
jgi:transposase